MSNALIMFISEMFSELYITLTGVTPGGEISHSRKSLSLFDEIEQLYVTVSPGQSMSSLDATISELTRSTDAVNKM